MMVKGGVLRVTAVGLAVALSGAAEAQPRYRVKTLDLIEQNHIPTAHGLNDAGRAVGRVAHFGGDTSWGVSWDGTGTVRLPGMPDAPASAAYDINASGVIAGMVSGGDDEGDFAPFRATTWVSGQPRALAPAAGFLGSRAHAINGTGDVAGVVWNSFDDQRPAIWQDGTVTVIGTSPGAVHGINGKRQVLGDTYVSGGSPLPWIWENGQFRSLPPPVAGKSRHVAAINEAGVVLGSSGGKAVLWYPNGSIVTLSSPPNIVATNGVDLNDRGEVVATVQGRPAYRPPAGGGMWDLWSLIDFGPEGPGTLLSLREVYEINNRGQILARLDDRAFEGPDRIVLLEPVAPSGSDTQPPSLTLTSPASGTYATDMVVMQATASDNVGVAGVQFYADGVPVGAEDTTAPYSVEWDLVHQTQSEDMPVLFWAVARDAAGNRTVTNLKSLVIQIRCHDVGPGQVVQGWLGTQTGSFTVRWTGFTGRAPIEGGFGVSSGRAQFPSATSGMVLFAPDGEVKVRDATSYRPTGLFYQPLAHYRFRMVVDVPSNRYSVWYRLPNQPERPLASGYRFRGNPVTKLDFWMIHMDALSPTEGRFLSCNVRVTTP